VAGLRILIVDDDPDVHVVLGELLAREHAVLHASDAASALATASADDLDVVLLDLNLGQGPDGFTVLARLRALDPDLPVVILSSYRDTDTIVRAMKAGAAHYIGKTPRYDELAERIQLAVQERQRAFQVEVHRLPAAEFVGTGPAIEEALSLARRGADEDIPVLILGETGTGKSLLARCIHQWGKKQHRPFREVNIAALPSALLDSELFGHERGSYTGAERRRRGLFELASSGTIFLDEIGDLSRECQIKLLQVVEEGRFRRLGSDRDLQTSARVITATHQDLRSMAAQGTFRRDLYYRIAGLRIQVPPLREHRESIPRLARLFAEPDLTLTEPAIELLTQQPWPGNVRELHQTLRLVRLFAANGRVGPEELTRALAQSGESAPPTGGEDAYAGAYTTAAERFRREYLVRLLKRCGGNVSLAARESGLGRSHLHSLIKRLGLTRHAGGEAA
jgi:DNA-binding NtrC family response regulator